MDRVDPRTDVSDRCISADVITDWNEKAVAFVTPRMVAAAAPASRGDRPGRDVRCGQFDRTPLPTLPGPTAGVGDGLEGGRCRGGGRHASWWDCIRRRKRAKGRDGGLSRDNSRQRRQVGRASSSARRSRQKFSKRGPRTARTRRMPIGPRRKPGVYVPTPITVVVDLAERKAVRHDEPGAIPAASRRSRSRASSGPPTTTRSRHSAAGTAPSAPRARPRMRASG